MHHRELLVRMTLASRYPNTLASQAQGIITRSGVFSISRRATPQDESRRIPSIAECAAHLELLQAFHHIRIQVQSSTKLDDVFEIKPEKRTVYRKRKHSAIDSENQHWPFELSGRDRDWFQEKTGLHPDLFGFLTNDHKAFASRGTDEHRELRLEDIPEISIGDSSLDLAELKFLDSCRVAVSKDNTVEKLVDAVQRQSAFVDKMEKQLWIRSPAVEGTLSRGITRYERFLKLFKLYPGKMLVPTLDIDLVWHTHQCSSAQYGSLTTEKAGRFIDHNDKLGTSTLNPAFDETMALYRIRFADEYRTCLCWDCEALRSTIAAEDNNLRRDVATIAQEANSKVDYYRAVEIARRKGERLLPIYSEHGDYLRG
ncbi:hypothetical protein F4825DRAFT_463625 [Nemania diffusa]|nr:hypothetical protein F4825DRAFT_463625 [Nemania diffusa]